MATLPHLGSNRWLPFLALVSAVAVACSETRICVAFFDESDRPQKPVVAEASDEGLNAIGGFKLPEGWKCELFAAEPDIANPVALYVDNLGRVFVCESYRQNKGITDNRGHDNEWLMADLASKTVQDRIDYHRRLLPDKGASYTEQDDRIRMLVDKDNDGKVDESVVFADHFNQLEDGTGASVLVRGNTAYYTCIPKVWSLTDKDGDGKAEERTVLSDGYGVRVAFRGHDMHGLVIGPDGRLYFSIGDRGYHVETPNGLLADPASGAVFRCELDGSNLEVFATGLRNPQELTFDDYGRLFTGDNNSDSGDKARWVNVVRGGDTGWRMYYQYHPVRGPFNRENIWKPYSANSPAYIVPPIANISDGPSGLTYYPGTGLGEEYRGTFLLCDFRGQASNSGVRFIQLKENGAFFEVAENKEAIWHILATDVDFGPDGSIYVCDWVNGWNGEGKGRVYRFFDPKYQSSDLVLSTKQILAEGVAKRSVEELAKLLIHPDRRVRFEAQWQLASLKSISTLQAAALDSKRETIQRLHGVWGLGQIARNKLNNSEAKDALIALLKNDEPWIVATAITALADAKAEDAGKAIVALLSSDNPHVKFEAGLASGTLGLAEAIGPACELLVANNDVDPMLRHAGIMALAGQKDLSKIVALKTHPSSSVRVAAAVALRKRADARISEFLQDIDKRVAVEAARAINDLTSLHTELPKLAATLGSSGDNEALIRRCLNAHFRLGEPGNAEVLAAFASDNRRSDEMRMEAVEMLASWSKPGLLDRVINDYRPLPERSSEPAKEAMRKHLAAIAGAPNDLRTRALDIASKLGITEVLPLLNKVVLDKNAPGEQRASALAGVARLEPEKSMELIAKMADDATPEVRIAAMKLLVEKGSSLAGDVVKKAIDSKIVAERQAAWDQVEFLKLDLAKSILEKGVARYLDRTLPADCRLNLLQATTGRLQGDAKAKLDEFLNQRNAKRESEPLIAFEDCIEGGDFTAGRDLFFNRSALSCVRCHKVVDKGGEVGPPLTDIGAKKKADYLLEAIVAPNAKIAEGFDTTMIGTDDGQIVSGILKGETEEEVQLLNAEGNIVKISKDSIQLRKKGPSSMPADLLKHLNDRELRDLVAYLSKLDGKNPAALIGSSGGHE